MTANRLTTLLFFLLALLPLAIATADEGPREIPRKILVLYDNTLVKDVFFTNAHQLAEMPLNYLGLHVVYRSIQSTLPTDAEMKDVRGVLTWFRRIDTMTDPSAYCRWMQSQIEKGRRYVILGEPGFFSRGRETTPACHEALATLGVEYLNSWGRNPYFIHIEHKDSKMVEFERRIEPYEDLEYSLYRPVSKDLKIYLSVRRSDMDDSVSALVFAGPRGGFVHASYVYYQDREIDKVAWRLNPFLFFEEAFGMRDLPRPDLATVYGRRVFYSQIDGDGIFNISHIDQKSFSGEIILDEILKKYRGVPITAGLITGYFDMPEFHSLRTRKIYGDIFSLPHVEPASHGYAHPLIWSKGTVALKVPGYKYSPDQEIRGSMELVNGLLQKESIPKSTRLFQWTGNCLPSEDVQQIIKKNGYLNINGGDSRMDSLHDSYAFVLPIGILRGGQRQIYASFTNENIYTNLWREAFYGYRTTIESFDNTESPYRLKPLDVYYHFYSGERHAALSALKAVYDNALARPVFAMWTSRYAQMAEDFYAVRIFQLQDGGFRVTQKGEVRSLRFDHQAAGVDLTRSKGVLGFSHLNGSLYVHLDETPVSDVYLSASEPVRPYIEQASFDVKELTVTSYQLRFLKKGWYKSEMILAGLPTGVTYEVSEAGSLSRVTTDGNGRLALHFQISEGSAKATEVVITRALQ